MELSTRINKERYADRSLREIADSLGETKQVSREIFNNARKILEHRDGTHYEDLAFVDTVTNKSRINKDFDFYDPANGISACKPNKPMLKMLSEAEPGTIIGIHNHPHSNVPTTADFEAAAERQYKYGMVFCHNGTVFRYNVMSGFDAFNTEFELAVLTKALYNSDQEEIEKSLYNLVELGVNLEVLK